MLNLLLRIKGIYWIIIILIVAIALQFSYYKYSNGLLFQENLDLKTEKKEELKKVRDSAFSRINEITIKSKTKFDSIINIEPKIKWYPYEKPIFIDRTLNDALDSIASYKYNR